jgi:hypothetical protein
LIHPSNRRLKMFHLVVSLTLLVDVLFSGFILSNY